MATQKGITAVGDKNALHSTCRVSTWWKKSRPRPDPCSDMAQLTPPVEGCVNSKAIPMKEGPSMPCRDTSSQS